MSDLFHPPQRGQLLQLAQGSIEGGVMRATLEQLKAMSSYEIGHRWGEGEFPFDAAAGCGHCVTSHDVYKACTLAEHAEFRVRARELWHKLETGEGGLGDVILANMEEFYALRLFTIRCTRRLTKRPARQ